MTANLVDRWARPLPIAVFCLAAAAALLITVHGLETFAHLPPCPLCLRQREPYWWSLPVAALAVFLLRPGAKFAPLWGGGALAALAVIFAIGTGFGVQHVGVEEGWWKAACTGGGASKSIDDMLAELGRVAIPACDQKTPFLFGLTLAAYNILVSSGLACLAALGAWRALSPFIIRPKDKSDARPQTAFAPAADAARNADPGATARRPDRRDAD